MGPIVDIVRGVLAFTGGLSFVFLLDQWLGVGLSDFFEYLKAWYAFFIYPIVEPLLRLVSGLLGVVLPVWWRDAVTLLTTFAGATVALYEERKARVSEDGRRHTSSWEAGVRISFEFSLVSVLLFLLNLALRLLQ